MLRPPRARLGTVAALPRTCPECGTAVPVTTYEREVAGRMVTMRGARCPECSWLWTRAEPRTATLAAAGALSIDPVAGEHYSVDLRPVWDDLGQSLRPSP